MSNNIFESYETVSEIFEMDMSLQQDRKESEEKKKKKEEEEFQESEKRRKDNEEKILTIQKLLYGESSYVKQMIDLKAKNWFNDNVDQKLIHELHDRKPNPVFTRTLEALNPFICMRNPMEAPDAKLEQEVKKNRSLATILDCLAKAQTFKEEVIEDTIEKIGGKELKEFYHMSKTISELLR